TIDLPSFPTRRSSDLFSTAKINNSKVDVVGRNGGHERNRALQVSSRLVQFALFAQCSSEECIRGARTGIEPSSFSQLCSASSFRSEEHTSELQSRGHL